MAPLCGVLCFNINGILSLAAMVLSYVRFQLTRSRIKFYGEIQLVLLYFILCHWLC